MKRGMLILSVAPLLAGVGGAKRPLVAQTLGGVVLEAGSDRPVGFAELTVLDTLGAVVTTGFTDGAGRFEMELDDAGAFQLYTVRLGYYTSVSETIPVDEDQYVEVAIRLQPQPIESDSLTVEVEGRVPRLERVGFYQRQRAGVGWFTSRLEISARRGVRTVADVVREAPGVRIRTNNFGKDFVALTNTFGGTCRPYLILDGIAVTPPWEDMVELEDLDGLEVYTRASQVPARFRGMVPATARRGSQSQCGLVVAWTRGTRTR